MKVTSGIAAVALVAVIALFFQNQNLNDRVDSLEQRVEALATPPPKSPAETEEARRVNALSTCLAQLHAQVVSLWHDGLLPPDGRYCKRWFYGLGPRVGD